MGISGLLKAIDSIIDKVHISQFKGKTVAVDGYAWLHRAVYSCSQALCLGEDTDRYVASFMGRVKQLKDVGIVPYIVFDGANLPAKAGTEKNRQLSRDSNRTMAMKCLAEEKKMEAKKYFDRAVEVTADMAYRIILRLKAQGVLFIVAPYEADAQLAYLSMHGIVDAVISEDSDCIPFGCNQVLFKLDRDGHADLFDAQNLEKNKGIRLASFTKDMVLDFCILSGCDYLPSIPGFGIKKAHGCVKRYGSHKNLIRRIRFDGKASVPVQYEIGFRNAKLTFRHQLVFDPRQQKICHLTPLPSEITDEPMDFLGPPMDHDEAKLIANGLMHPDKKVLFESTVGIKSAVVRIPPVLQVKSPPIKRRKETAFTRMMRAGLKSTSNLPKPHHPVRSAKRSPSTSASQPLRKDLTNILPVQPTASTQPNIFSKFIYKHE